VAQRLRLSNAERDHLAALVAPPPAFVPPTGPDRSFGAQLYRLGPRLFADLVMLDLARLLVMGQDEPALVGAHRAALGAARKWKPVKFPLKGQDVIDAGVPAAPTASKQSGASASRSCASGWPAVDGRNRVHGHFTSGGSDMRIASTLPPVMSPKRVPRS
jgi:hypothetical protein